MSTIEKLYKMKAQELMSLIHSSLCIVMIMIVYITSSSSSGSSSDGDSSSSSTSYHVVIIEIIVIFIVSLVPGQITQLELYKSHSSLETKSSFVRYVSHEIRSPLNILVNGIDMLRSELKTLLPSNDNIHETLIDIHESIAAAIEVTDDILTYESIESNKMTLNLEVCPLSYVFHRYYYHHSFILIIIALTLLLLS